MNRARGPAEVVIHPLSEAARMSQTRKLDQGFTIFRPVSGEAYEDLAATLEDARGVTTVYTSNREVPERIRAREGRLRISSDRDLRGGITTPWRHLSEVSLANFLRAADEDVRTLGQDFTATIQKVDVIPSKYRDDNFLVAGRLTQPDLDALLRERWRLHGLADKSLPQPVRSRWSPIVPFAHVRSPDREVAMEVAEIVESHFELKVTLGTAGCRLAN